MRSAQRQREVAAPAFLGLAASSGVRRYKPISAETGVSSVNCGHWDIGSWWFGSARFLIHSRLNAAWRRGMLRSTLLWQRQQGKGISIGNSAGSEMKVVGLFAGIGGLELGLTGAGHETLLLCEVDPIAQAVLHKRLSGTPLHADVRTLKTLPKDTEVLTAGFPCQDLSQAGTTRGLKGRNSSLVDQVFRLVESQPVPWLVLENVSFMLQLQAGAAIRHITNQLERLGYHWAYRVVDTRAFGLPQRRERVFLMASLEHDPARYLLTQSVEPCLPSEHLGRACGFYWTEGIRGLGWAVDAVPTLKGGSTIGIPSAPGIWMPDGCIITPDIRDAERLQGFPADWTKPAESVARPGYRWKLVGNAVTVRAAKWIGTLLRREPEELPIWRKSFDGNNRWPRAACGSREGRWAVDLSTWPVAYKQQPLAPFLRYSGRLLSYKAVHGFLNRLTSSSLKYPSDFLAALRMHERRMMCHMEVA